MALIIFNLLVHGFTTGDHALLGTQPIAGLRPRQHRRHGASATAAAGTGRSATGRRSTPDGGRTAFFVINLVTMLIPIGCLWFSRHVLGLDDPLSDNVVGQRDRALIGQVARFYLFRTLRLPEAGHRRRGHARPAVDCIGLPSGDSAPAATSSRP